MSGCKTCGCKLGIRNTSGYCRKHLAAANYADPAYREKQREGIRRKIAHDPEFRAAAKARALALSADKDVVHRRTQYFRENRIWIQGTAAQAPEIRAKAGRTNSARQIAWCPPALRDDYRSLIYKHHFKAAEARAMIEEQHELEMARWRRSIGVEVEAENAPIVAKTLTPIERAMAAAAWTFDVKEEEILSKVRERRFAVARYALGVVLQRAGLSTPAIAKSLNKNDHTSALHWIKRGLWFEQHDPKFARRLAAIQQAWDGDERIAA